MMTSTSVAWDWAGAWGRVSLCAVPSVRNERDGALPNKRPQRHGMLTAFIVSFGMESKVSAVALPP